MARAPGSTRPAGRDVEHIPYQAPFRPLQLAPQNLRGVEDEEIGRADPSGLLPAGGLRLELRDVDPALLQLRVVRKAHPDVLVRIGTPCLEATSDSLQLNAGPVAPRRHQSVRLRSPIDEQVDVVAQAVPPAGGEHRAPADAQALLLGGQLGPRPADQRLDLAPHARRPLR